MRESIDNLLGKAKNRFLLSNAVAARAKQITGGSLPYINDFDPSNPIITAIREISSERVTIKIGTEKKKKVETLLKKEEKVEKKKGLSALDRLSKHTKSKPAKSGK
ncbi:MAG: DNA-directed RNA polymerase subunit omega [Candidatus Saganbacteria bacterium]|nr:DNA-directed RNA polymerase subunit omega [Candidatus Saganbacteria bacterium]